MVLKFFFLFQEKYTRPQLKTCIVLFRSSRCCFVASPVDTSRDQRYQETLGWKFLDIPGRDEWIYVFTIQIQSNSFISKYNANWRWSQCIRRQHQSRKLTCDRKKQSQTCNDIWFGTVVSTVVINMYDGPIGWPTHINKNVRDHLTIADPIIFQWTAFQAMKKIVF